MNQDLHWYFQFDQKIQVIQIIGALHTLVLFSVAFLAVCVHTIFPPGNNGKDDDLDDDRDDESDDDRDDGDKMALTETRG